LQKANSSVKIRPVEKKRQGGAIMAKCAVCEKGAYFGNNVSHSHRRSNKMWKSNVLKPLLAVHRRCMYVLLV
jgi:large subunit ribosomal protein L28